MKRSRCLRLEPLAAIKVDGPAGAGLGQRLESETPRRARLTTSGDRGAALMIISPLLPVEVGEAIQHAGVEATSDQRVQPLFIVSQRLQRWND